MCTTCGCGGVDVRVDGALVDEHEHDHSHDHGGHSSSAESPGGGVRVDIETELLAKNDHLAQHNRDWLLRRDILALNLMSSPGSGKTTLLERTIREAPSGRSVGVIEGDQETTYDADRIKATGASVIQINTGSGCHLDADMLARGLEALDPPEHAVVFVENVGNLVCPALFDLGESAKVVIISVTEGDDKPLKYPHMFAAADLVVINKTDLLPYVDFDVDRCARDARRLRPGVAVLPLSARTGQGMAAWYSWLHDRGE
jgi:hydrogenase nickel incorporation protein HypB